jgi:hypothetical protein
VVGLGKAAPGLLILRAPEAEAENISDDEYLNSIWPIIQEANSHAEAFSRIPRDLVAIMPSNAKFPRTDKGSLIRAQVHQQYNGLIESLYIKENRMEGAFELDITETESLLLQMAREELGLSISGATANFFSEGVDSLKAIHFRRLILQHFKFQHSHIPTQNVIFDAGSISQLAQHICALQKGDRTASNDNAISVMTDLIEKYSVFQRHAPRQDVYPDTTSVVSTSLVLSSEHSFDKIKASNRSNRFNWCAYIVRDTQ